MILTLLSHWKKPNISRKRTKTLKRLKKMRFQNLMILEIWKVSTTLVILETKVIVDLVTPFLLLKLLRVD